MSYLKPNTGTSNKVCKFPKSRMLPKNEKPAFSNLTLKIREFRRDSKNNKVPAIILQGKKLEEYGFKLDQNITVTYSNGLITILPKP